MRKFGWFARSQRECVHRCMEFLLGLWHLLIEFGFHNSWRNVDYTNAHFAQFSGNRQCHANNSRIGGRICHFALMTVERCDMYCVDDDTALLIRIRCIYVHQRHGQSDQVERGDRVHLRIV